MTAYTEPITHEQALDDSFEPPRLKPLMCALPHLGFGGGYDFDLVYYLINKGQSGIHKICSVHNDYREALKALAEFDPALRPHTEVRVGLLVEGQPVSLHSQETRRTDQVS